MVALVLPMAEEKPIKNNALQSTRDRELIARIAVDRDMDAFEQLYESYRVRLGPFLFRIVRDAAANEETFNDVMLTVWKKADQYQGESQVSTWIYAIAYRQCLKCLRGKRHEKNTVELPENLYADVPSTDNKELVAKALTQLSEDHRMAIELSYFWGSTYQEIADIAGCPESTVKTRVFHARQKLKLILNQMGGQSLSELL